jgi:hypothetical protein
MALFEQQRVVYVSFINHRNHDFLGVAVSLSLYLRYDPANAILRLTSGAKWERLLHCRFFASHARIVASISRGAYHPSQKIVTRVMTFSGSIVRETTKL